jgi:hypothetical protein
LPEEGISTSTASSSTGTATSSPTSSSTSSASNSSSSHHHSGLSTGAIVGIAVGGAAVLLLAAALFYLFGRERTLSQLLNLKHSPHGTLPPPSPFSPASQYSDKPNATVETYRSPSEMGDTEDLRARTGSPFSEASAEGTVVAGKGLRWSQQSGRPVSPNTPPYYNQAYINPHDNLNSIQETMGFVIRLFRNQKPLLITTIEESRYLR